MVRVVASSTRGPARARAGLPCQDAWLAVAHPAASLAVVCDGMGSRVHAHHGARAAALAARDAWRLWRRSPVAPVEDLVRLLEVAWRVRLRAIPPDDAATTCVLYAEDGHGRAALAQLGDGLLARRGADGSVGIHPAFRESFGATFALGTPHTLASWSLALGTPLSPGEALVLATDGVSEDLDQARIGDLALWVIEELAQGAHPGRLLGAELRQWPVPHHRDDKTLLIMWKPWNPDRS